MTGSGTETLTAALRRLADEHASGLLAVATPGHDVVLELVDGTPVGIGPSADVSGRVGRDAAPSVVAAAVIDQLLDRTVVAMVADGGSWTWDVSSDADMTPVPEGLATELSRRAVDATRAMATLDPDLVLQPGRDLETSGQATRVRALFDGERSLEEVAEEADLTVPAVATIAAALVRAGVLSTGMEDPTPRSWTETVAGSADDDDEDDEDEPELWVMDEPGEDEPSSTAPAADRDIPEAMEWVVGDEAEPEVTPPAATSGPSRLDDDGWDDTTWLDELDGTAVGQRSDDARPVVEGGQRGREGGDQPLDARAALSSMLSEFQGGGSVQPREQPPPTRPSEEESEADGTTGRGGPTRAPTGTPTGDRAPTGESAGESADATQRATDPTRKEPRAEPGEVAEFLRELSRLALGD